jgi:hypothetical protein
MSSNVCFLPGCVDSEDDCTDEFTKTYGKLKLRGYSLSLFVTITAEQMDSD